MFAAWDPDRYSFLPLVKCVYLIGLKLMEEEETQINGVHLIVSLDTMTLKHVRSITPSHANLCFRIIQDCLPIRVKRIDFVKEPGIFDAVFVMIKPFIKDKLLKRIFFNGKKFDKIHEVMNPDYLPTDLGGKRPLHASVAFLDSFIESDASFQNNNKFGFMKMGIDNSKRISQNGGAAIQGLGGTIKKLDC